MAGQRACTAPLDSPALHLAALVRGHDVHPGMRVAEHELHERALDLDRFALVVGRRERVVRIGGNARQQSAGGDEDDGFRLHDLTSE